LECDSLTADLVIAEDHGGTTLLAADPEALARFLAECRALGSLATARPKEKKRIAGHQAGSASSSFPLP
jgi:hypothetical protein